MKRIAGIIILILIVLFTSSCIKSQETMYNSKDNEIELEFDRDDNCYYISVDYNRLKTPKKNLIFVPSNENYIEVIVVKPSEEVFVYVYIDVGAVNGNK